MIPITVAFRTGCAQPPSFMEGASDLCTGQADGIQAWWIGDPAIMPSKWQHCATGMEIARTPGVSYAHLRNLFSGYRTEPAINAKGEVMHCPVILDADGAPAFAIAYGPGFKPTLSEAQERALTLAKNARAAFESGAEVEPGDVAASCAELLSMCNYLSPEAIASLRFIDDLAIVSIMRAATGLVELRDSNAGV